MIKLNTEMVLQFITLAWVVGISFLSGLATYCVRLNGSVVLKNPWVCFFQDILYCQIAGLITYFLAVSAGADGFLVAGLVSAGSHMGARLVFTVETLLLGIIKSKFENEGKK